MSESNSNSTSLLFSRQMLGLVGWLLISFAAAAAGAFATGTTIGNWYPHIEKPWWTPRTGIFPPVWITLFTLMAVSAWLVWRIGGFATARLPLALFLIQLALASVWSAIFFTMERPDLAAIEIVVLWLMVGLTCIAFWKKSRSATLLLAPYLIWITYLAALTIQIARLNPRHPL